jgi:hypothetical protein
MRSLTLFVAVLVLVGCTVDANSLRSPPSAAPYKGAAVFDAGTPDAQGAADTDFPDLHPAGFDVPPSIETAMPDAVPTVEVLPPSDVGTASDLRAVLSPEVGDTRPVGLADAVPVDTAPPLACVKLGPWTQLTAYPAPLPVTAYCFTLCPVEPAPQAIDYMWSCMGFTDADRAITINGQAVKCGAEPLPALVSGGWSFVVSAGGGPNAFIQWGGALRTCP